VADLDGAAGVVRSVRDGWLALGIQVRDTPLARFVTSTTFDRLYDANFATCPRPRGRDQVLELLDQLDDALAHCTHRKVRIDDHTADELEAELALRGYAVDGDLVLLLTGELARRREPSAGVTIRALETDADWESLELLARADHEEEAVKEKRPVFAPEVTRQIVRFKRAKVPDVHWWMASLDGEDVAFFSSWPGIDGVGVVEDLFCRADVRGRGIADALLTHAVDDARAGGAGRVVIGARVDDWPKSFYARRGFEPVCVDRTWLLSPPKPQT
jgi:GNAT superfamily N-acetyltransferase